MKKLLAIFLLVIVALGGAAYYYLGSLNSIVKEQVEKHGSSALQTTVKVGGVNIKLLDGLGEITGFSIANPKGFSSATAIGFDTVRLDIGTENITEMPIVIEEILIDSVTTLYELDAQGKGNLNVLLDQIKAQSTHTKSESKASADESSSTSDIRIVVKKLVVKDTQLALDLTALGQKRYDETLPTFSIANIGGSEGLPPEQLGQAMGQQILDRIVKQAKAKQKDKLMGQAKEKLLEKLDSKDGEKLKGLLNKFGS
ncbi:AsmA family protein [Alkalimarinus alittae]|uniref:AsmA domain-containing protein n=1 Tax=Alkalimarinus alittae TaxID=2961619 RepID=A0ABY6N3V7_9ALTE|nr:hypothetical protein [Alkalimarinus alittae]UZE96803.1 hypothetical protein NKI27_03360 [Alkalimarinus alittae]